MKHLKITYKGKSYNSLSDVFKKSIIDTIKKDFSKKLKPFENEIANSGGQVIIDIPESISGTKIDFDNIPKELADKIIKALQ